MRPKGDRRGTWIAAALVALLGATAPACGAAVRAAPPLAATGSGLRTAATATRPANTGGGGAGPSTGAALLMGRANLGDAPAPNFTLTDQLGRRTSLSQFRGKVVLLAFMDDECTTICPLTTVSLVDALHILGPAARQVRLVAVNANPTATSVSDVYAYDRAHGVLDVLSFLTGSPSQLARVWRAYHVDVAVVHGGIDHTPSLLLIDQKGRERYLYLTSGRYGVVGEEAQLLAWDVARLLPSGAAHVAPPRGPGRNPLGPPGTPVTLPSLFAGAAPIHLGSGQPHVIAFVASWTPGVRQHLQALNAYAAWAARAGGPTLVAVDEAETEPSLAVARGRLSRLGLSYPLAVDAQGYVADAYRAQDLAWVEVVAASGRILAFHDGWPTAASLIQRVRSDQSALKGGSVS